MRTFDQPLHRPKRRLCGAVIEAQNKLSGSVLEKCPGRPELEQLITKLMDYPRNHIPFKRGGTNRVSSLTHYS